MCICAALVALVFGVFGRTVFNEFINYDDHEYVYENPAIIRGLTFRSGLWAFAHTQASNWHPLTTLSHMLDCELFGLQPGGHHLMNVVLHAAASVLLFVAVRRLTGAIWRSAFV